MMSQLRRVVSTICTLVLLTWPNACLWGSSYLCRNQRAVEVAPPARLDVERGQDIGFVKSDSLGDLVEGRKIETVEVSRGLPEHLFRLSGRNVLGPERR